MPNPLLNARTNEYGGLHCSADDLPDSATDFAAMLADAVAQWREQGYFLVWLPIPIQRANLIPSAVAAGFEFHHASENQLMLTKRMTPDAFIPPYALHAVGVGGAVFNEREEVLVVIEKKHAPTRPGYYKLPGGLLDPGEHIVDALVREIREETGVETRFESLVTIRHQHNWRFGASSLYLVCRMSPLSSEITIEEAEIAEAKWMRLADFWGDPQVHEFNKHIVRTAWEQRGLKPVSIASYASRPRLFEVLSMTDCR
ncbi:MAG: NUDIX domain-containing protein [Caldilineales bacterium]|nr:NUDIX domain-containing protein [Caldilineales bacterium]